MTDIALSDEDFDSEAARHIEQSLSVNRALKYPRHTVLCERRAALTEEGLPRFPPVVAGVPTVEEQTLDVDSRFLCNERIHLRPISLRTSEPEDGGDGWSFL